MKPWLEGWIDEPVTGFWEKLGFAIYALICLGVIVAIIISTASA